MEKTFISIIIPTYNRYNYLGETLDSVLAQTYKNWECIVVDDGSIDYTQELVDFYADKDSRFQFLNRPDNLPKGANYCRNYGFKNCKGKYIQWLDSDDIILQNKLEEQIRVLKKNDASLITCKWGKILDRNKHILFENLNSYQNFDSSLEFLNALTFDHGYFPIHAYLMKRGLIDHSGLWLETLQTNQDGEFMIRVIINSEAIIYTGETAVYYRKLKDRVSTSSISVNDFANLVESWKLIEAHLKQHYSENKLTYIDEAKKRIYIRYRDSKGYIKPHKDFFEKAINEEPSDFKLNFYRLVTRYKWSTTLLRFFKNLMKGKLSIER